MKKLLIFISLLLPLATFAQGWEIPTETQQSQVKADKQQKKKSKKAEKNAPKYLAGAAPKVDGKVQWTLSLDLPGQSASQIYDKMYAYLQQYVQQDNQIEGSKVALINKEEHSVVASVKEWMIFKDAALSLDRAQTHFVLQAQCADGKMNLTITRIIFDYTENVPGKEGLYFAEDWIADDTALNKKQTKIYVGCSKFRRKMIDRKDAIFEEVKKLWK